MQIKTCIHITMNFMVILINDMQYLYSFSAQFNQSLPLFVVKSRII